MVVPFLTAVVPFWSAVVPFRSLSARAVVVLVGASIFRFGSEQQECQTGGGEISVGSEFIAHVRST